MTDVINTHSADQSTSNAPEGHEEKMIAAVDAKETELEERVTKETTTEEKPEKILGKFDSVEDLTAAYQELERKQSAGKDESTDDATENESTEDATEDDATEVAESAGLNMEELQATYAETGELSEDQYAALEAANIDRETVDRYIRGQEAEAELLRTKVFSEVGGEDKFNVLADWAANNLTDAEKIKFNETMDAGDFESVKGAVQLLEARYQKENGNEPKLLNGENSAVSTDVFNSTAQLTAAMKDPRYATDEAYRQEVAAKLARSQNF